MNFNFIMIYPYTIIKYKDCFLLYKVLLALNYNVDRVNLKEIVFRRKENNYITVIIDFCGVFNNVRFYRIGHLDYKIPRTFINDLSQFIS